MTDKSLTKRLTFRASEADFEKINQLTKKHGKHASDIIRNGVSMAIANEKMLAAYEERFEQLIDTMSLRFDLLVSELREDVEETKKRIADIIEADHALIAEFSETMNQVLNHMNASGFVAGRRSQTMDVPPRTDGVRYGPTGAPIFDK